VKVRGYDGSVYILRHDEIRAKWELTMYQAPPPQSPSANTERCCQQSDAFKRKLREPAA
jgi:hypothetical protein